MFLKNKSLDINPNEHINILICIIKQFDHQKKLNFSDILTKKSEQKLT